MYAVYNIFSSALIRQYAVAITANLCMLCIGLGLAWPSPVLIKLRNETETVLPRPLTVAEESWVVSIGFIVGLFANFFAGYLVDRIGRKSCMIFACVPKLIAFLTLTLANDLWMLLFGRALNGIADSISLIVVPMYASEVASKEIRGALGTILQIICSLGIVIMLSMGPFIPYLTLNIIITCILVVVTIPQLFLPDSPYFLYSKGKTEEATKVLIFLRGSESLANEEIKEYSLSNTGVKIDKRELFKNRLFMKSLGITIVLGVGASLIGFNAVTFYLQTILESTGASVRPEIASVIIGMIQLTASFCTASLTDRFGRKPIIISTLLGMTVGMMGLGLFFTIKGDNEYVVGFMNFVPLISLIIVVFCYSSGIGSLNWLIAAELFDDPSRGAGCSTSLLASMLSVFLTAKYFAIVTLAIGPAATYWIFSANCVLLSLFVIFCLPETKGRTFAEIQIALGAKNISFQSKETECNTKF